MAKEVKIILALNSRELEIAINQFLANADFEWTVKAMSLTPSDCIVAILETNHEQWN